jgi:hypothetical protein
MSTALKFFVAAVVFVALWSGSSLAVEFLNNSEEGATRSKPVAPKTPTGSHQMLTTSFTLEGAYFSSGYTITGTSGYMIGGDCVPNLYSR